MASRGIKDEKSALRKQMKERLGNITKDNVGQQSASVVKQVLAMPEYQTARSLGIFLSMHGKEISTTDIVLNALRGGKKVFIPYIHSTDEAPKSKVMDMLRLKDEEDLQSLKPDAWGIPSLSSGDVGTRENAKGGIGLFETTSSAEHDSKLDLIFMPGMAFDTWNNRLGHGKGFYDRYLSELDQICNSNGRQGAFPKLIGLALREQILPEGERVPTSDDDWRIDTLVSAD